MPLAIAVLRAPDVTMTYRAVLPIELSAGNQIRFIGWNRHAGWRLFRNPGVQSHARHFRLKRHGRRRGGHRRKALAEVYVTSNAYQGNPQNETEQKCLHRLLY